MLRFLLTANILAALTLCIGAFIAIIVTRVVRISKMYKRTVMYPDQMIDAVKMQVESIKKVQRGGLIAFVTAVARRLGWPWGLFVIGFIWLLLAFLLGVVLEPIVRISEPPSQTIAR